MPTGLQPVGFPENNYWQLGQTLMEFLFRALHDTSICTGIIHVYKSAILGEVPQHNN